ncbi:neogenin isoform X2 [Fopius arisanus]|uniref:Neogenin isoform X2 n=1 Tax=Fopius arisanus TaxID=64838 RepID=A0A9R1T2F2_9HYME|nr:PREDICTED: neogenin isoform X2 [Fopius arisanus]
MDYLHRIIILLLSGVAGGVSLTSALHFKVEPEDTAVEEGGPARLDCSASSAFGPVTIQWRSEDGQPINFIGDGYRSQLANGSLDITSVSNNADTTGKYQCLASVDNIGAIVSRVAEIKVATLPEFREEPHDTMLYLGQIAYLACALPVEKGRVRVQWLKDEHPLIIDDSRMTLMPSGALEIDDVRTQDVGSYRCNVSGYGQSRLSGKAQLSLLTSDLDQAPTAPIFVAKPQQQVAVEGSTITLECAANGYPKPSILWLKDGVIVDLATLDSRYREVAASSLMITDVMEEDNGSYQCRAENRVETLDAVAELIVQVPPRFVKRPEDKVANKNQDLEFECEIYGKPEPRVTWLKNGEIITLSEYWQIVNSNNLRINGLLAIDAGIFQCVGVNPAGSIQAAARLTINMPKKNPPKTTTPKSPMKKKKLSHRLYNNTWQHPSTLLGHTLSAFTPNPPSMTPQDDPSDLQREIDDPNSLYDPASHFLDDSDDPEAADGGVPSAPRNLSVVIVKTRFVTLRWESPANPNGDALTYNVYYKQDDSQRERVQNTAPGQLDAVVRSLQPGVTYEFRVVAHNLRGAGASSETLRVTTHSEADVPGPPLNLEGFATSSTSIKLVWMEPKVINGRISKYVITYMEGEGQGERTRETTSITHELINLVPYTEYSIWVHAVNENGPGASTGEISMRTYSAPPTQPPHNVTLEAASSSSIIIRWEPPLEGRNGIITGYKIQHKRLEKRYHSITITTEGNTRLHVLTGLMRRAVYHIRMCALNVNGTGPWTEWLPVETYENDLDESVVPSAPSDLRSKAMADSISLLWSPPKDDGIKVRGYIVGWGKGFPDVYTQPLDGKQRFFSLENLEPLSEYVISLRATNEAGEGPPIYANVRTTEKSVQESVAPLIPPVGLKAIVLSANTVVLYWIDNSLSKSQYVTDNRHYEVRYAPYHPMSYNPKYKYFNASDLNCMIDDLKPNMQYQFTVRTVKGKRQSPWSMIVLNQTQEAAPTTSPRDLVVQGSEERPSSVVLKWQPPKQPNGQIIGYILSYSTDNTKRDRDWLVDGIVGNRTEYVVKGLRPGTTYYFKMQARNLKGYGPFSSTITFKTLPSNGMDYYDELHDRDGKQSTVFIYVIVGCTMMLLTVIAIVVGFVCCRRSPDSPDRKKGYMKDPAQKTSIKPPDLWIHHDQMELKALEKSSMNGEACTSGVVSNTLPRSGNSDYNQENVPVNSSSLDKRTYVPSYMAIATATPIVNGSMSQPTIHNSCTDGPTRPTYPRTVAQYSLNRAHITLEPTPESSPDSSMPSAYDQLSSLNYSTGPSYTANSNYAPGHYGGREQSSGVSGNVGGTVGGTCTSSSTGDSGSVKRLQGHPLKSFSVPAPPPQSAPSTPQQKHGISQVTVRPSISGSPYKKQQGATSQLKNRLTSVSSASHTPEEIERLKPSYSTEELNQEMANLEGLMKDLNAITASEFEC